MKNLVLGIDAGARKGKRNGGMALISIEDDGRRRILETLSTPIAMRKKVTVVDVSTLTKTISQWKDKHGSFSVVLEKPFTLKKQGGVDTMWRNYERLCVSVEMADMTFIEVLPKVWKTALRLTSKKEESLKMYKDVFSSTTDFDGIAEGALLAHYYAIGR